MCCPTSETDTCSPKLFVYCIAVWSRDHDGISFTRRNMAGFINDFFISV